MNPRKRFMVFGAAVSAITFSLAASAAFNSIGTPDVEFLVAGPAGLKITGTTTDLSASEADGKLTVVVPLTNIKTGIGLRDEHTRKYIGAAKFPNATLVVDRDKLKVPEEGKTAEGDTMGQLTLHGVTKPVKVQYQAKRTGSDFHIQGHMQIDIKNFGIEQPCYLGVCTDTDVKIKVKFKLREK